jgi:hypothetical protein
VALGASVVLAAGLLSDVPVLVGRLGVAVPAGVVVGGRVTTKWVPESLGVGETCGTGLGSDVGTGGLSTRLTRTNAAASNEASASNPNTARMAICHLFCTGLRSPRVIGHNRRLRDYSTAAESSTFGRGGQKTGRTLFLD